MHSPARMSARRAARAKPSMQASRGRLSSSCRAADECSPHYVTNAQDLADASQDTNCDVLYVVGGLYGNVAALDALEEGMERERRHGLAVEVCFNGDFNFFNASTDAWARINRGVRALGHATAGNVEREALNEDGGCGCAYPPYVDAAFADRASTIVERLRDVSTDPDIAAWLSSLPFAKTYAVGGVRICCVHGHHTVSKSNLTRVDGVRVSSTPPPRHRRGGAQRQRDPRSTEASRRWRGGHEPGERQIQLTNTGDPACANGWAFSSDHLPGGARPDHATDITKIERWFEEAGADVFACAHTCRPVLQKFENGIVANNGAAGLGNFRGDPRGLVTRVARADVPSSALGALLSGAVRKSTSRRWRGAMEIHTGTAQTSAACASRPCRWPLT